MSDVTQKDVDLAALIIRNSKVAHGSRLIAEHRIAAGKAVLDRLRNPTHEMVRRLNAACDTPDVNMSWVFPFIAAEIGDALETKR